MLSCKEPGGLFAICSQGISHCGEIPVRARVLPRETQRRETLLAEEIYKKGLPKKTRQRVFREEVQKRGFACGKEFSSRISFASQNKCREESSPQIFPFGKSSRRGLSKSICKLSARAQGNPACAMIGEASETKIFMAPSLRELAHHAASAADETEGVALLSYVRSR